MAMKSGGARVEFNPTKDLRARSLGQPVETERAKSCRLRLRHRGHKIRVVTKHNVNPLRVDDA